jgi:hypothetical protein
MAGESRGLAGAEEGFIKEVRGERAATRSCSGGRCAPLKSRHESQNSKKKAFMCDKKEEQG